MSHDTHQICATIFMITIDFSMINMIISWQFGTYPKTNLLPTYINARAVLFPFAAWLFRKQNNETDDNLKYEIKIMKLSSTGTSWLHKN